ncbi:MAG: glycosyltransferase, partial [Paracoccaceae bacterium]
PIMQRWRDEGFAFDVIDAEFFYPDGPAAMRLADEFGVPFSVKARGADIHYWGRHAGSRSQILRAADAAGGMLCVAESLRRDMAALGMNPAKIRVHYTAVDLDRFRPTDRKTAKAALGIEGPLIASVGALIPRKGHDILIPAIATIPEVTLIIAGAGPAEAKLRALAQRCGVEDRVRLLGNVPHADLPRLLAAADVMALASESEGLANAWVEAMACGTPIVTTDVDGAREAVDRPAAGVLLAERTPAAFAAAIRQILASPPDPAAVRDSALRFNFERNTTALFEHLSAMRDVARRERRGSAKR